MKRTHLIAVLVGLAAICIFATDASAYYDPGTGRFLSRDPIGTNAPHVRAGAVQLGASGPIRVGEHEGRFLERDQPARSVHPDGPNLYQYVRSNPQAFVDPLGLQASSGNCDRCGVDATGQLKTLLHNEHKKFYHTWNHAQKLGACMSLYNVIPGTFMPLALNSWDIDQLPGLTPISGPGPNCATGKCENTILVDGQCHNEWAVNYVLFGNAVRMCDSYFGEDTSGWMLSYATTNAVAKGDHYVEKVQWALAGYLGWFVGSASTPPAPSDYKECLTDCQRQCPPLSNNKWRPHK